MSIKSWCTVRNAMFDNKESLVNKFRNYDKKGVEVTKDEIIYLLMSAIQIYLKKGDDSSMSKVIDASEYWLTNTMVNPGEAFAPIGSLVCFENGCKKCESWI